MKSLSSKNRPDAVGGIIALGLDLLVRQKGDVRIGVAKQRDQLLPHAAGQPAAVALLELHRIGKPAHGVAERADRELDQDLAVCRRIIVGKTLSSFACFPRPHFDAETDDSNAWCC